MKKILRMLVSAAGLGWLGINGMAAVELAPLFRDHAVVQRDQPLPVWGTAAAGEKVSVNFRGQTVGTTADTEGRWAVRLAPLPASAEPATLTVEGENKLVVTGVLTGDVWLASGQSNMEWRVEQAANAAEEIVAATHPLIRQFDVPNLVATRPQTRAGGSWEICSPATAARFSAVAYYFARDWQAATGVPVGIINSTWGGTPVESWMSTATLASDPAFKPALARWDATVAEYPAKQTRFEANVVQWEKDDAAAAAQGKAAHAAYRKATPKPRAPVGPGHHRTPAGLYNGMIAPLVPYALSGAIWYQGEGNANYPAEYGRLFAALIQQWRGEWGRALPFYFVQLANFNGSATDRTRDQWAWLREAQTQALALPHTGMAVTIDIGAPRDIHPKNKQDVGRRLALIARHQLLGEKIEFSGPRFKTATPTGSSLRLAFDHADGLTASGATPLAGFEVAGADRKFFPAEASIEDGASVVVMSPQVAQPVAVRYAWRNAPDAWLKNSAGLPAAPFRSDEWSPRD